jgi:uncharacterized protein (TIGR01777 family)
VTSRSTLARMRVAVTEGPPHLVGGLAEALLERGDEVVLLERVPHAAPPGVERRHWDPLAGLIDGPGLSDVDAAINMFGSPMTGRWSPAVKEELRGSRATGTLSVVSMLDPDGRCQRLLTLSSTRFYADAGAEPRTGDSPRGSGFLAQAIGMWEAAARHSPVPTALLRTPAILARGQGYLARREHGLRGRVGTGRQYVPWIHLTDWVNAVVLLLGDRTEGPLNIVAPADTTEAEFVATWARVQRRRVPLPVPDWVMRARFGADAAQELWWASARAVPQHLLDVGFAYRYPDLESALAQAAGPASAQG